MLLIGDFVAEPAAESADSFGPRIYKAKSASHPTDCIVMHYKVPSSEIEMVRHEVEMLKAVAGHPSVQQLLAYQEKESESSRHVEAFMVMKQPLSGRDLFDVLSDSRGGLTEKVTRPYARALLDAVMHCHLKGVIHRDIKLENVLVFAEDPVAIKLIDFGRAVHVGASLDGKPMQDLLHDCVGRRCYMATELANLSSVGYIGPPVDVWSIGAPTIDSAQHPPHLAQAPPSMYSAAAITTRGLFCSHPPARPASRCRPLRAGLGLLPVRGGEALRLALRQARAGPEPRHRAVRLNLRHG